MQYNPNDVFTKPINNPPNNKQMTSFNPVSPPMYNPNISDGPAIYNPNVGIGSTQNQSNQQNSIVNKLFEGSPLLEGGGTSISDLKKLSQNNNTQKYQSNNEQTYRQPTRTQNVKINVTSQKNNLTDDIYTDENKNDKERNEMRHFVKDVNKSLDDYLPSTNYTEDSEDDNASVINKNEKINNNNFIILIKESFLLFIFYLLISQNFFKSGLAYYSPSIVDSNNAFTLNGQLLSGFILVILFVFFKNLLIH